MSYPDTDLYNFTTKPSGSWTNDEMTSFKPKYNVSVNGVNNNDFAIKNPYYNGSIQGQNRILNRIPDVIPTKLENPYSYSYTPYVKQSSRFLPIANKIKNYFANRRATKTDNDTEQSSENRAYNTNVLWNGIKSLLRYAPAVDSFIGYFQKKSNTPDYSDITNAKNYAMRETPVYRYSPTHITGNMKFNPYDYSEESNKIFSQSAAAQNLISRQGRGNLNALAGHINNLLANTSKSAGNAYLNSWKANEAQRMAVAQENRRADEYNASADTNAESAYINARNAQTAHDKINGINALNNYAQQKYGIKHQYEQELDAKRNEMVSNIGEIGRDAYNKNAANTDTAYNYWTDQFGRHHYIPYESGVRQVDKPIQNNTVAYNNNLFNDVYDLLDDADEKTKFAKMSDVQKQQYIINKFKKNNGTV